jgi:hypothetical protein
MTGPGLDDVGRVPPGPVVDAGFAEGMKGIAVRLYFGALA